MPHITPITRLPRWHTLCAHQIALKCDKGWDANKQLVYIAQPLRLLEATTIDQKRAATITSDCAVQLHTGGYLQRESGNITANDSGRPNNGLGTAVAASRGTNGLPKYNYNCSPDNRMPFSSAGSNCTSCQQRFESQQSLNAEYKKLHCW